MEEAVGDREQLSWELTGQLKGFLSTNFSKQRDCGKAFYEEEGNKHLKAN